jgi:GH24 family phage-related lysozyme (muramidase)
MADPYNNPLALSLLKRFEGYTPRPAWDHKQYSVGFGTRWKPGTPIGGKADHEAALAREAGAVDSWIAQNVKSPLDPNKRAALVSFGYNLGTDDLERLLPDINAGDWNRVGSRMLSFNKASGAVNPGLVKRRQQEAALLTGSAPAPSSEPTNGATMATPIGGAPIAGGPVPLTPPSGRRSKLADMLLAQAAGAKVSGWGDALRALGGAALGYSMGNEADKEQGAYRSKLAEMLSGSSPDNLATTLLGSGDEDLMKAGVQMRVAQAKPQATVGRFRPSKQGIVDTVTGQVVPGTEASGADSEYGTDAKQYIDKDGNLRYTQLSKAGGRKDIELPEGAKWTSGVDKIDTGTEVQLRDKRTGAVVVTQPKNITGKESQEEIGKQAGGATVALPGAKTMVDNAFKTIGELRAHPGLEVGTGASNVFDPRSWIPGTQSYDFQAKNKQATGQSFMAARDSLKGAGQVTDFEGAKGEQAIANLDAAQSKEQYLAALDTLEKMMRASYEDLQRKAGMAGGGAAPAAQPAPQFDINAAKQKYGLE